VQIEIQANDNAEVEKTLLALENQPNEAAEILVRKARELARGATMSYVQSVRLSIVIATAYERSRRHVEAVEVLRPRVREVSGQDDRYWRARASSQLAKIYLLYFADFDASTKVFASAVADFDAADENEWVASTLLMLGIAHRSAGSPTAAADAFERARDACSAATPLSRKIDILSSLQTAYNDLGRFEDAKPIALTLLPLADSTDGIDDALRAVVWAETAVTRAGLEDKKAAERYLARAIEYARTSADPQAQISVGLAQAQMLDRAGKSGKAIELLTELSVQCTENRLLLSQFDVLRQQVNTAKGARNYGAALGAMEALMRLDSRLQVERGRLKLAEIEVQRNLDSAQAFTRRLQAEVGRQTVALEETISKLKKEADSRVASEKRSEFLAGHDIVTALATRRRLATKIEDASSNLAPTKAFAVMLIAVETTSGFLTRAGISRTDELLAQAAKVITQTVPDAFIARFGDFSFACLIGPYPAAEIEEIVLESGEVVCHALAQPIEVGGKSMSLRASAGITVTTQQGETVAEIIAKADAALLHAQSQFDSRAYIFDETLEKQIVRRRDLESDLNGADQSTGIFVVFQPLVDAQTSEVKGFESLVRWNHGHHGAISPVEFVPLAESVGAIERLGLLIAELALTDFSKILRPVYSESYVTVNVSMLQLRDTHFASNMLAVSRKTQVEPKRVVLEITESQIGEDNPTILANLKRLRLHGYRLAIDDFGTGYSSLWRLGQIDMQTIKIARELVVGAHLNEASSMLLVRAVQICHDLGRTVVAEGIEGEQERENAVNAGCDQLQGYMFARPMTAAKLITHLAARQVAA
jgi:diguanylate cyclase (GGDEF)-like protein